MEHKVGIADEIVAAKSFYLLKSFGLSGIPLPHSHGGYSPSFFAVR